MDTWRFYGQVHWICQHWPPILYKIYPKTVSAESVGRGPGPTQRQRPSAGPERAHEQKMEHGLGCAAVASWLLHPRSDRGRSGYSRVLRPARRFSSLQREGICFDVW